MNDLPRKTAVAIVLLVLAGLALWYGGLGFWLLAVVAGILMMGEWADLHGATATQRRLAQFALSVPLAVLCPLAAGPIPLVIGLIAGAGFFIAATTRKPGLGWGAVYVGLPAFALVLMREQPGGLLLTLWAMSLVWATDTGAYFSGRLIGGPKIAPSISPKKTWAGLIGGAIAATLLAFALHAHAGLPFGFVMATPVLAVVAQAGDFYESWLKRRAGVKDSSNLLPGHGGVLDRLDGLVPVAIVAAAMVEATLWLA
ncbi:phosphatidate cytidylyltransferase [Sphingomonas donggukensis]|uniref:Phosphatidate cytidylyltransferase n=1 Tax=Sphingomonas donggukensis TaxID=2949093 RepID=A0ABY4TW08_9SPHN|nr:phosphatidate cytidylyltransferase [Sphingomonas donggukensis]URW76595.1 phosphatidate cytidylyltransferase [Sphingomonas donggukensis]